MRGSTSQLLPGWTLIKDGIPLTQIYYAPLGVGAVYPVTLNQNASSTDPIDIGPYSLSIFTGGLNPSTDIRLSQVGSIPSSAIGLKLFANASAVSVLINGRQIGKIDAVNNAFPTLDVSAFAGQTVNLEFRFPEDALFSFDIRGFTSTPEPAAWALFALGAGVIGRQAWCRRN
jgi:hypothetical protein